VADIMRAGPRNAVAGARISVKDALMVMTRAKSGSLSVVNRHGKLVGVFTDGDFRRHMAADENLLTRRLERVMTCNPVRIRDSALAIEAVRMFDECNIDDLIVVDARNRPVGLVDSQDLPKLKLM
jgi:arabinose-5-phosphate isomerase